MLRIQKGMSVVAFGSLGILLSLFGVILAQDSHPTTAVPCVECIRVRVGIPNVVRGPSPGIPDSQFAEIQLPGGHFRGFSASSTTYAIDGTTPENMSGAAVPVLKPASHGAYGESGEWINHVERSDSRVLAWVHDETGDKPGMGLKSMSLAVSNDDGLTWQRLGQIITGTDALTQGKVTGEGDCSALNGGDGYYYAYCARTRDHAKIVARAPVNNPGPGHWMKWFNGAWSQPGLRGNATPLENAGLAHWNTTGQTIGLGAVPGGIGLFLSKDHTTFAALSEPLLPDPPGSWSRPDPSELSTYFSFIDAGNGSNQLGNKWLLSYTYIQPNESFGQRYLVFRPIDITISPNPVSPQIGVMLARWYNAKLHDRWATTAAVPGNNTTYRLETALGYLMTAADPTKPSVELEDCVSQWPGHPDHVLVPKGVCEAGHYQRLRTAGWVYSTPQPGTQPLYRCYSDSEKSHFAATAEDCDQVGHKESLLGYDLKQ